MNYGMRNLYTSFETKATQGDKVLFELKREGAPCFQSFFSHEKNGTIYDLKASVKAYYNGEKEAGTRDNFLLLERDELDEYINELTEVVPFEYSIEEDEKDECMIIHFTSLQNSHFKNKWILSSIRNIYEFPKNIAIKEAIEIKKTGLIKDTITNLYITALRSMGTNSGSQTITRMDYDKSPILLTNEEIKNRIEKKNEGYQLLNDIYKYKDHSSEIRKRIHLSTVESTEYGSKEERFDPFMVKIRTKLIHKPIYKELVKK